MQHIRTRHAVAQVQCTHGTSLNTDYIDDTGFALTNICRERATLSPNVDS